MKILVRLPNWLGDMVMSVGFMHQLPYFFPGAEISVIAKKEIHDLLSFFPEIKHQFIFNKKEFSGIGGLIKFGNQIKKIEKFDLFFCLPDSFSSAIMGAATGSGKRIGYKNELRRVLLTNAYSKPENLHRVEEYIKLVELYTNKQAKAPDVFLRHNYLKQDYIAVNINSEASSRRLTVNKAVEILKALRNSVSQKIILIGAAKEKEFVEKVLSQLTAKTNIENAVGRTSLTELTELLASAKLMLTTDSGPAHLSNALGTYTIVLFGAGNENNTAPYNKNFGTIIRLGVLSCEPCEKNICVRYATPQCLERLNTNMIMENVKQFLHL